MDGADTLSRSLLDIFSEPHVYAGMLIYLCISWSLLCDLHLLNLHQLQPRASTPPTQKHPSPETTHSAVGTDPIKESILLTVSPFSKTLGVNSAATTFNTWRHQETTSHPHPSDNDKDGSPACPAFRSMPNPPASPPRADYPLSHPHNTPASAPYPTPHRYLPSAPGGGPSRCD